MTRRFALLTALAALTVLTATPTFAHKYKQGSLEIIHPWTRATPKSAKVGGGYMTLINSGNTADRLVAVETDAAGKTELHEMSTEHGVMKMRPLPKGIALPAGETVTLAPGGLHVMFLELKAPFAEGAKVPARLIFEKAGAIDIVFAVEKIGARGGDGHHQHGGH